MQSVFTCKKNILKTYLSKKSCKRNVKRHLTHLTHPLMLSTKAKGKQER
jgi:hypothetical protein